MSRSRISDRCVLDWIRFSVPYQYDPNTKVTDYLSDNNNLMTAYQVNQESAKALLYAVMNAVGLDGENYTNASVNTMNRLNKALWSYDSTIVKGHSRFMYKEAKKFMPLSSINMGVCVELSSHALRDVEQSRGFTNWLDWFSNLFRLFPNIKFTRIDIASDFFHKLRHLDSYHLQRMVKYQTRPYITPFRTSHYDETNDTKTGAPLGSTFYLGKPQSKWMLRVYDKKLERIYQHGDTWLLNNKIKNWCRWEVQYNRDSAPQVADLIGNGVSPSTIWLDSVRKILCVCANDKDKNTVILQKSKTQKVEVPEWWADFVDYDSKPKFDYSGKSPHYTYDRHMNWLGRAVLPSFVKDLIVQIYLGGDPNKWLNHVLNQSLNKLTPKDIDDLVQYANQIQLSKFHQSDDSFDFRETVEAIGDKVTGMIAQRVYDQRNDTKLNKDDLKTIPVSKYEDFMNQFGVSNHYLKLKHQGVI